MTRPFWRFRWQNPEEEGKLAARKGVPAGKYAIKSVNQAGMVRLAPASRPGIVLPAQCGGGFGTANAAFQNHLST